MRQEIRKSVVISTAILFHAFLVFHLLFSPVIIVMASFDGTINASFVVFVLLFLLSLFFGRAYCSWFCPGCGVQEILSLFVRKKAPNKWALKIKYAIFVVWMGAIATGYLLNGLNWVDLGYGMANVTTELKVVLTVGAVAIILPLTAIFGQFASCKYVCWQAPFMVIGTKIREHLHLPGIRLKVESEKCIKCGVCSSKCPMNIDVMANVQSKNMKHSECILCGSCIDNCSSKAIVYSLKQ